MDFFLSILSPEFKLNKQLTSKYYTGTLALTLLRAPLRITSGSTKGETHTS